MIDLHLHTTASDGRCAPRELVARARQAGLSVIAVVDHDTFAAQSEVAAAAEEAGVRAITGIEITSVWNGIDVHVLGYYLDPAGDVLADFLERQRADRVRRVGLILERLRALGAPVDPDAVRVPVAGRVPHAVGRPHVARALVRAGHVRDANDAFDRYLGEGRPAFVPRVGASPVEVVRLICGARGVASLAHPGLLGRDELIPDLVRAGMQALEAYHPDHPPAVAAHYRALADGSGIAVSGGSDYHADEAHGAPALGSTTLPRRDFEKLEAIAVGARS